MRFIITRLGGGMIIISHYQTHYIITKPVTSSRHIWITTPDDLPNGYAQHHLTFGMLLGHMRCVKYLYSLFLTSIMEQIDV